MPDTNKSTSSALVPAPAVALEKVSDALVRRGREDLEAAAHWIAQKIFEGSRQALAVSPEGHIATHPAAGSGAIEIYSIDQFGSPGVIPFRNSAKGIATCFAWRADGRYLGVITSEDSKPDELQVIDVKQRKVLEPSHMLSGAGTLVWSQTGNYLAVTSWFSGEGSQLNLWAFERERLRHIAALRFESASENLNGCGALAFADDEKTLTVWAEVGYEADNANVLVHGDELFVLDVPTLRILRRVGPPDTPFGLSCRAKQRELVMNCTYGKTFLMNMETYGATPLPFQAGSCCCHPEDDSLCAFAQRDKIFIGNLKSGAVTAEYPIVDDEIETLDMRWSSDGDRLYAASGFGQSYTYTL